MLTDVAVVEEEYVPAAQAMHDPEPSLYEPAGQVDEQELAPLKEDVPLEQAVQAVFPVPVE